MNRNLEIDTADLSTLLGFVLEQRLKDVHTALPALIETYDPTTKRARVQPAIELLLTDGSTLRRPPIVNVPVVFPGGGGFTLLFPMAPGDPVMLIFSQRGLTEFKRSFAESPPTPDRLLDLSDAVAVPGFGSLTVSPATEDGVTLQSESGETSIQVLDGQVAIRAARVDIN